MQHWRILICSNVLVWWSCCGYWCQCVPDKQGQHTWVQVLAGHIENKADHLSPGSIYLVLTAFAQYSLHVPSLLNALADASESQLSKLT